MNQDRLAHLLERVQSGKVSVQGAIRQLRTLPFEDLGFASVDHHRNIVCRRNLLNGVHQWQLHKPLRCFIVERRPNSQCCFGDTSFHVVSVLGDGFRSGNSLLLLTLNDSFLRLLVTERIGRDSSSKWVVILCQTHTGRQKQKAGQHVANHSYRTTLR